MNIARRTLYVLTLSLASLSAHALDPGEQSIEGADSGSYDYLAYAVTWQPTFCLMQPTTVGCDKPKNDFYTHGIWPYYKSNADSANRHPSSCKKSIGCEGEAACTLSTSAQKQAIADQRFSAIVTPSPEGLMAHEWQKHGTCYGGDQKRYFDDFSRLRKVVDINPGFYDYVGKSLGMDDLKKLFPSNTSFRCSMVGSKQYLFEVYFLIDQEGNPYHKEQSLQIGDRCLSQETFIPAT